MDSPSLLSPWAFEPLQLIPTLLSRVSTCGARGRSRGAASRCPAGGGSRFWTGIALVVLALNSPIDALGEEHFFFMHMLQHVILGDLAPLCFVAGLTGPILRPVLAFSVVERLRVLAHPLVALPIWAVDLYVWHIPFLYDAALHHTSVHAIEHLLFFTCGCLIWEPVLETLPAPAWFGTGREDRLHLRRPPDRDGARQRLHLVELDVLHRRTGTRPSGASRRRTI